MIQQYIDGELVDGLGKPFDVINPATDEVIASVGSADSAQTEKALSAAQRAFETWSKTSVGERISWLLKLREACLAEREKSVELISKESGRPYPAACGDFDWCMGSFYYYAEEAKRIQGISFPAVTSPYGASYHIVERRPLGVVVGHLAWNYPLGNAGLKIGPSVVSGCCCIIKPSSKTPLATLYLGVIAQRIGFPPGVLNIVAGHSSVVGKTLNISSIPSMITLIGSRETGLQIMRESLTSVKKFSFELGGNAPVIVDEDADIKQTSAAIVAKKVGFAGQTCVNYNRIYVHEKIYPALCKAVEEELSKVVLGKWKDPGYVMGPLIDCDARDYMLDLIADAVNSGARLVMGGEVPKKFSKGSFMTPALLVDVNDTMRVSTEEIFGPIIPLQSFSDFDEVLKKANNTIYGLSSYYYGHDARRIAKAFEELRAGEIFINGCPGIEQAPHAGVKQSGIGCDKSKWSLEEYLDFKYLAMIP
jgi:succinate-semialdehyde dehydrogenase/glutarate-semialdehyde dehydrogenase